MHTETWIRDWTRGFLTACVLAALAEGENHGYAIAQQLQDAGLGPIKGGTLYPLLSRLEQEGLIEAIWRPGEGGPGRKVFALTAAGIAAAAHIPDQWQTFTGIISPLLTRIERGTP